MAKKIIKIPSLSGAAALLGAAGRARNTPAQQEASRRNGKKGGRPTSSLLTLKKGKNNDGRNDRKTRTEF